MWSRNARTHHSSIGAAIPEFAILAPFLILLLLGLLEVGRLIQQVSWVAQGSYEAAVVGGERLETVGPEEMETIREQFHQIINTRADLSNFAFASEPKYQQVDGEDVVVSHLQGQLRPISGLFEFDIAVRTVGPHTAQVPPSSGDLLNFDTVAYYDCDGNLCPHGGQAPCESGPCDRLEDFFFNR